MTTIEDFFANGGQGPYPKPLKVRVLAKGDTVSYTSNDGTERQAVNVAVSDGQSCVRVVCYDSSKFAKLSVGNSVMFREVIRKREESGNFIVATKNTKIFLCGPVDVPEAHVEQCSRILNPPPAATVTISTALGSPVKKKNSIKGKIVQEEDIRQVKVKGADVEVKTLHVEDMSGRSKVTVWREACHSNVKTGDYVSITDVVINIYKNETGLTTTARSQIEKTEAPEEIVCVEAVCISVADWSAELLLNNDDVIVFPAELLLPVMPEGLGDVEQLTSAGPVCIKICQKGSEILSLELDSRDS